MSFIGIDIGASFIKGAVLDLDELELREIERLRFPSFISDLPPLKREVDPLQVIEIVRSMIERLLLHGPCEGIVMCGQMHGLVLSSDRGGTLFELYFMARPTSVDSFQQPYGNFFWSFE